MNDKQTAVVAVSYFALCLAVGTVLGRKFSQWRNEDLTMRYYMRPQSDFYTFKIED